ncbi:MAG: class I SAM-dependent methyltransferase [Anderseniella sp.]|jgi:SAM-dependent methyltransferase|nr:class I SAM-dependent methyltransferase [Anderseniella sp.]
MTVSACPVCDSPEIRPLLVDRQGRAYHRCEICLASVLDPAHHLPRESERAHYLTHENEVDDPRYRAFLARLAEPLLARLKPGSCGLDYGCGPGPALAAMLREAGHQVDVYDPFFAPDAAVLDRTYDFITCTETAEHFHSPASEFARLASMLRPAGILAVMTMFQTDDARFEGWHYRLGPTHVVFYRAETFAVIAARLGLACEFAARDVAFLTRPVPRA